MLRDENDFARKSISASSSNMDFNIFSNEKSISVAWTVTNVNDIFGLKVVKKKGLLFGSVVYVLMKKSVSQSVAMYGRESIMQEVKTVVV